MKKLNIKYMETTIEIFQKITHSMLANINKSEQQYIHLFTNNTNGTRSHKIWLNICEREYLIEGGNDDTFYIGVELNRNQVLYLRNALDSFINEHDIDINLED